MTTQSNDIGGVTPMRLKSFIDRILTLEEEKREIQTQIKEVFAEAKGEGFDTPTMREIIKEKKLTPAQRRERQELLEIYRAALGMLDGTPLGNYARRRLSGMDPDQKPTPKSTKRPTAGYDSDEPDDVPLPFGDVDEADDQAEETAAPEEPVDLEAISQEGKDAARDGKRILDNPYPHNDQRRAA